MRAIARRLGAMVRGLVFGIGCAPMLAAFGVIPWSLAALLLFGMLSLYLAALSAAGVFRRVGPGFILPRQE